MVFFRAKVVVFEQKRFFRKNWLYLGNVVVFEQGGMYLVKSGCIRGKVDVFMQKWL